jgi:hypothetical protein
MRSSAIILTVSLSFSGLWLVPAEASAQANSEAALILRVLAYDRSLPDRAEDRVTILAVHGGSSRACDPLVRALNQLGRAVSVGGMHARAVTHAYEGPDELLAAGRETGASVVYMCPGFSPSVDEISEVTRRASLLSISGREAHVRSGLTVAIVAGSGSPRLVVNIRSAEAEGVRLDAALLRIATVVR